MKKIFVIQMIAAMLCTAMMVEIGISVNKGLVVAEADLEMEDGEGNEDAKEKAKENFHCSLRIEKYLPVSNRHTAHSQIGWKPPTIDLHTPPPEKA